MTGLFERIRQASARLGRKRRSRFVQTHAERRSRDYAPSFVAGRRHVNAVHPTVGDLVEEIRGKLEPDDQLKLYEAGFYARGPLLEIGRLHGRSTVLLAMGIRDAGGRAHLTSIEYVDRYLP